MLNNSHDDSSPSDAITNAATWAETARGKADTATLELLALEEAHLNCALLRETVEDRRQARQLQAFTIKHMMWRGHFALLIALLAIATTLVMPAPGLGNLAASMILIILGGTLSIQGFDRWRMRGNLNSPSPATSREAME